MTIKKLYSFFRSIALLEGLSLLVLYGVAMPLKYIWDKPQAVQIFGMAHGVLFVLFMILLFILKSEMNKNFMWIVKGFIASMLPFGTMYLDAKTWKPEYRNLSHDTVL